MGEERAKLLSEAELAARRGDLATSAVLLRRLLEQTPNDLVLLQRLGDALARSRQEPEAREIFRRLAADYWNGGFRTRAIAALRRAARLGEPDWHLLRELGERTLDLGLGADARAPLLEAAALAREAGDISAAREIYQTLIEALPRDLEPREFLAALEGSHGTPRGRAAAGASLALARSRGGDHAGAWRDLDEALQADPEELSALDRLPEFLVHLAPHPGLPAVPGAPRGGRDLGWSLIHSAVELRAGKNPDPLPLVRVAELPDPPPRALLWAGRLLLEADQLDAAARALVRAAEKLAQDPSAQAPLVEGLTGFLARDPGRAEVLSCLTGLTGHAGPLPDQPAGTGEVEAPEEENPLGLDEPVPMLSPEVQARVLEVDTLLQYGLREAARESFEGIPEDQHLHPAVAKVLRRMTPVSGPPPPRQAPVQAPAKAPAPAAQAPADDELVVVLDGETGPLPPGRPGPGPPPPPPPAITSPVDIWSEQSAKPDLDDLQRRIQEAIPVEDEETEYQMAIGLLEMGLEEQAVPLLETALSGEARRGDAALALVRVHQGRGEPEKAITVARSVLDEGPDLAFGVRAALLSVFAGMLRQQGEEGEAGRREADLAELVEHHPEILEFLRPPKPS